MDNNYEYELILNHITAAESTPKFRETYEDYKKMAYLFLNHNHKSLFADQILSEYTEGRSLEEIFSWNKDRFVQGNMQERNGKREQIYYDLWSMEVIPVEDEFFNFFFATKFKHIDLLKIDEYLDYHLVHSYKNELEKYLRVLILTIRKYEKKLLSPEIVVTVNEWIKEKKRKVELSGTDNPLKTEESFPRQEEQSDLKNSIPDHLSVKEAAEFLKLKITTLYEKTSKKLIPHFKKGNKLYFNRLELQEWIKTGKVKTQAEIDSQAATYLLSEKKKLQKPKG